MRAEESLTGLRGHEPDDYRLRAVPDSLCEAAAKVHVLAHLHQRMVVERTRFNSMRLVSSRNRVKGPTLRLHGDPIVGWDLHSDELRGSLLLFYDREQHENGMLAWWGLGDLAVDNEFFALSADPNPSPGEEGGRYILPVVCGPYAEPLISLDREYWLRYPRFRSSEMPEGAVPRILTPSELKAFLEDTTDLELRTICERYGWVLSK